LLLGGAAIITPGETEAQGDNYRAGCAKLGVEPRDEGWALWYTSRCHPAMPTQSAWAAGNPYR
jgi:hypothetical protein